MRAGWRPEGRRVVNLSSSRRRGELCARGLKSPAPFVVVAKVDREVRRDIRRKHSDGREDKYIFVRHVEASEGIVIMGPSEHN